MDDPDPATSIVMQLVLLFVLILLNAFFAMSEIAIISLNDTKTERLAEEGHKKAKLVMKLTSNSSNFLSTIQIGVTLAGFLTSASASQSFVEMLSGTIQKISLFSGVNPGVINAVSMVLITIITSYFSLVLGELAPKKIAMATFISKNAPMVCVVPPTVAMEKMAPMPAINPERAKTMIFILLTGMPMKRAVVSFSPIALLYRPTLVNSNT